VPGEEDAGEYFADALARSGELVSRIKRDFQLLRPDQLRRVPRTEQGEEFDLNALVEAHSDRRGRRTPSDRLYVARKPEERDVATLFLIDMSASTDEPLPGTSGDRRVIDLTKDTLAVLSQVLGEIGDSYAIYGFSGHGRENVELYHVKSFAERLSDKVKGRLGGIAPKRSTRMGAALRHAGEKLARTTARSRHLILLSDGFPQDFDYGDDRRSNVYGIRDTLQALRELEKRGMQTFCITVDPAGHDYLGEMCPSSRYAVIDNIDDLPSELVRIYRKVTRS
jgi:nitric oxide reductase NorD protein